MDAGGPTVNAQPIPLFLDIDGVLVVYRHEESEQARLTKVPVNRQGPADHIYPSAVNIDPMVIADLNAMVGEGIVELVWLSSWDHGANRVLAPAVGLTGAPYAVAEIGSRYGDRIRAGIWIKTLAVGRWMKANRPDGSPMILVDDLLTNLPRGQMSPQRRSLSDVVEPGSLLVATDASRGMLMSQLTEIRRHASKFLTAQ